MQPDPDLTIPSFRAYSLLAMRTASPHIDSPHILAALGLAGEAGEVVDYVKKVAFHGHPLDTDKLAKEIGDVLWYLNWLAEIIDVPLEQIAFRNIEKLRARYPNGFSSEASIGRTS